MIFCFYFFFPACHAQFYKNKNTKKQESGAHRQKHSRKSFVIILYVRVMYRFCLMNFLFLSFCKNSGCKNTPSFLSTKIYIFLQHKKEATRTLCEIFLFCLLKVTFCKRVRVLFFCFCVFVSISLCVPAY